jgi:hypothetical protein
MTANTTTPRTPTRYPCGCPNRALSSTGECHCSGCGRHFTSPAVFDAHWQGTTDGRRCADPAALVHGDGSQHAGKPRFELRERASGPVGGTAYEGEHPFAARRREAGQGDLLDEAS